MVGIAKLENRPPAYNELVQTMTVTPLDPQRSPATDTFRVTPRLCSILAAVARYGVLSADQIARLDGGSRQKITRILQRTVEHKMLRRADTGPTPLLSNFFDARPRCYAITRKGLRLLAHVGMPTNLSPKRSNVLLAHEIETAEAMFFVNAAVAVHGAIRLVDQPDFIDLMPAATRALRKPLRLNAEAHPRDFPHLYRQTALARSSLSFRAELAVFLLIELEHAIEHGQERDVVAHCELLDALLGAVRDLEIELCQTVRSTVAAGLLGSRQAAGRLTRLWWVADLLGLAEPGTERLADIVITAHRPCFLFRADRMCFFFVACSCFTTLP
jgi:hypothetical protein